MANDNTGLSASEKREISFYGILNNVTNSPRISFGDGTVVIEELNDTEKRNLQGHAILTCFNKLISQERIFAIKK